MIHEVMKRMLLAAMFVVLLSSFAFAANPGHGAASVGSGTFEGGDYVFPDNLNVTQNFSVNGSTLLVDGNTGRVGIGTNSPGAKLDVSGNAIVGDSAASSYLLVGDNFFTNSVGSLNPGVYVYKSGNTAYGLKLQYDGTEYGTMMFGPNDANRFLSFGKTGAALEDDDMIEYMRIDLDNGNVGIGTTDPNSSLDVVGDINASGDICLNDGTCLSIVSGLGSDTLDDVTGRGATTTNNVTIDSDGNGETYIGSALYVNGSTGRVGIGSNSPSYKLDVAGTGRYTGNLDANSGVDVSGLAITSSAGLTVSGGVVTISDGVGFNFDRTTGTSPFTVDSTTVVTNLNADLLDGQNGAYYLDNTDYCLGGTCSGALNMNNNLITNIGNSGTDFTTGGALTLAGALTVDGTGDSSFAGNVNISSNNLYLGSGSTTDPTIHFDGSANDGFLYWDESLGRVSTSSNFMSGGYIYATGDIYSVGNDYVFGGALGNNKLIKMDGNDMEFRVGSATELLHLDGDGNNVGIGTVGPDSKLDVLSTSGPQIRATYTDGSVYTTMETDASGDFHITPTGLDTSIYGDIYTAGNGYFRGTIDSYAVVAADTQLYLDLDDDNDGAGNLYVRNGGNTIVTQIDESGNIQTTGDLAVDSGTVTGANGESIQIGLVDDYVEFQGGAGTDNTDLRIDLDGTYPVIDSPTDSSIGLSDTFIILNSAQQRIYSAGNDKYLDIRHNDADAVLSTPTGDGGVIIRSTDSDVTLDAGTSGNIILQLG